MFRKSALKDRSRGYTLIEIVIVAALLATVVSIGYALYIQFHRSNVENTTKADYLRLYTQLEAQVKSDLRSAVKVTEDSPGVYSIVRLKQSSHPSETPGYQTIIYWVNDEKKGVERHEQDSGHVTQYDFSKYSEGVGEFQFKIEKLPE